LFDRGAPAVHHRRHDRLPHRRRRKRHVAPIAGVVGAEKNARLVVARLAMTTSARSCGTVTRVSREANDLALMATRVRDAASTASTWPLSSAGSPSPLDVALESWQARRNCCIYATVLGMRRHAVRPARKPLDYSIHRKQVFE
jgi:hypothetical protein